MLMVATSAIRRMGRKNYVRIKSSIVKFWGFIGVPTPYPLSCKENGYVENGHVGRHREIC